MTKSEHARNNPLLLVEEALDYMGKTYPEISMGELGNIYAFGKWKTFKDYFTSLGVDHWSFDWNGEDGAIQVNLAAPIECKPFDIVTNWGTSEHVYGQYGCFRNVDGMCRKGGVMAHIVPLERTWPGHCFYYYTEEFFRELAKACDYKVLRLDLDHSRGRRKRMVRALLAKTREDFPIDEELFNALPGLIFSHKASRPDNIPRETFDNEVLQTVQRS